MTKQRIYRVRIEDGKLFVPGRWQPLLPERRGLFCLDEQERRVVPFVSRPDGRWTHRPVCKEGDVVLCTLNEEGTEITEWADIPSLIQVTDGVCVVTATQKIFRALRDKSGRLTVSMGQTLLPNKRGPLCLSEEQGNVFPFVYCPGRFASAEFNESAVFCLLDADNSVIGWASIPDNVAIRMLAGDLR